MYHHPHCRGPRERERERGPEKIFGEIIAENFNNTGKEIVKHIKKLQRVPGRINQRRNTPRHTVIKVIKRKIKC